MQVINWSPETISGRALPWQPLKLIPLGDIQLQQSPVCDLDLLQNTIDRGVREQAYFIGMGDYLDVASPSNRKAFKTAGFYDSVHDAMDSHMRRMEEDLMKVLAPTKGRWLGMLTGHHVWEYQDGTTTDTSLCRALDTNHLGTCAMVRLQFRDSNRHSVSCTIWCHHGNGAGLSTGAPLVKLERVIEWAEADLYLMGHQHKLVSGAIPRLYLTEGKNPQLVAKDRLMVGTGSYLKGYLQGGKPSYVEQSMLRPVSLGSPMVTIIPTRKEGTNMIEFEVLT